MLLHVLDSCLLLLLLLLLVQIASLDEECARVDLRCMQLRSVTALSRARILNLASCIWCTTPSGRRNRVWRGCLRR
jgi:hypothetical protein